ncbi:MAG: dihydroorotase [Ignavibacteriales bacterium]|nr:dihydroorotase [Ignavibacteriales bacterium]MCF8305666.1 dihydroorotase [Ignavibacteriales bacterium]MCF8315388.1 dihydroorotase [Ignavibacteriales bacterium]MCF8436720.1 dihydroorotase [Ignavibacteriales bacterium]
MKTAFINTIILDPVSGIENKSSLLVENGVISKVGELTKDDLKDAKVYNLEGIYCVPGLMDMHVHLREPGREDEETIKTGCNSAAAGGFTSVLAMPDTKPIADNAEVLGFIRHKAQDHLVDVHLAGAVSFERKGTALAPLAELHEAGAVAFTDDEKAVKTASLLKNALEYAIMFDLPVIEHCEEESLGGGVANEGFLSTLLGLPPNPSVAEELIIVRDILISDYVGGKVHFSNISTKRAVEIIRSAKEKGSKITADTSPHYFSLTEEALKSYDTNLRVNPPLRSEEDLNAVIEGLRDGTIDCITSDHSPHAIEEKEMEFIYAPDGIVGLETELALTLTELVHKRKIPLSKIITLFAVNPRKILNLPVPQIKVGEKAELTLIDISQIWTVNIKDFKSKCKNSPFDKKLLTGKSVGVMNNSKLFYGGNYSGL